MKRYNWCLCVALFATISLSATVYSPQALSVVIEKVPCLGLASLPTPLTLLEKMSLHYNRSIYIKSDSHTGSERDTAHPYGGNKIRKLAFLLAQAQTQGAQEIITFGCIGSNHVAATATLCAQLGLTCHAYLLAQPLHKQVLDTYQYIVSQGAHIHYFSTQKERIAAAEIHMIQPGVYTIPTGGSNAIGCVGYVKATLELYQQMIERTLTFDAIYLPGGSFGTAAGLWVGLSALGLDIPLKITYVNDKPYAQAYNDLLNLAEQTITFLQQYDPDFQPVLNPNNIELVQGYCGTQYGALTDEAQTAAWIVHNAESIELDHTYTAKCMAHLLDDITNNTIEPECKILFWNTYYPY